MAGNLTMSHSNLYACLISMFSSSPFEILPLSSCLNNAINVVVTINVQPQKYKNPKNKIYFTAQIYILYMKILIFSIAYLTG